MSSTATEKLAPAKAETTRLEFVVHRDTLLPELANLLGVVNTKTTLPILSNILFEAEDLGSVTLTATNMDRSMVAPLNCRVKVAGSVAVPARKLFDYARLLPSCEITVKVLENNWVQLRAGRSNTKMVGLPASNFPQVPVAGKSQVFKVALLQTL